MKINGTPDKNIFIANPDLPYTDCGILTINRVGKAQGSKILWALYMVYFPDNRIMFQKSLQARKVTVASNYLQKPDFDWDSVEDICDLFLHDFMSRDRRSLLNFTIAYDGLSEDISKMPRESPSQKKTVSTLLQNYGKMRESLKSEEQKFEQDLVVEQEEVKVQGNAILGARERRHR